MQEICQSKGFARKPGCQTPQQIVSKDRRETASQIALPPVYHMNRERRLMTFNFMKIVHIYITAMRKNINNSSNNIHNNKARQTNPTTLCSDRGLASTPG